MPRTKEMRGRAPPRKELSAFARGFMTTRIVPGFSAKFLAMFSRAFAAFREVTAVALTKVIVVIDMTVKMFGAMEPRPGTNKDAAIEPFRTVVSIRRAVVWRNLVVTIGANRRCSDADGNLCRGLVRGGD